jgi:hypothetical protein
MQVASEGRVVDFRVEPANDASLKGCHRPEFQLQVPIEIGDAFFNSPSGYRAQYLLGPMNGQRQNQSMILFLEERLISFAREQGSAIWPNVEDVRTSLRACSAKVWLSEGGMLFGRQLVEEIQVPEWIARAREASGAFQSGEAPNPPEQEIAIWGVRAARDTIIEVKGAYLDEARNELVPRRKVLRSYHIHRYGYS